MALLLALALVPAVALALRRGRLLVGAALVVVTFSAASLAFDVPLTDMRPRSGDDFFGPVLSGFEQGFLDFYDTTLPFNRLDWPLMHSVVLFAVFAFVAVVGLLLVARKPLLAGAALLVAAGWPATIAEGPRPLLLGALTLVAVLAVLYLVRGGTRPARALVPALAAALVLVGLSVAASTSEAVAKPAFLGWQTWDLYDAPEDPVGVRYIWNSHYQGITFPEKETVVLKVRVPGSERKLYWRATTLDEYTGVGWRERLDLARAAPAEQLDPGASDPLLPPAASDEENWVRQDVTVGALSDNHLIASAQPVRYRPGTGAPVQVGQGGVVVLPQALRPGQRYTAWSYVPDPKVSELAAASTDYVPELDRYLELIGGRERFPAWGVPGREEAIDRIFLEGDYIVSTYAPVYEQAREVVQEARSPYAAAVALEAWFRQVGGFTYNEQPPATAGGVPALVSFVLDTKQGYCQHYAGAMAVMMRMLGVPARVAAGFTSGTYDKGSKTWTVSDHNAHTWVEVYFPGYGWIPFDPTPGRGQLSTVYSSVSDTFGSGDAAAGFAQALGGSSVLDAITAEALRTRPGLEGAGGLSGTSGGGAATAIADHGQSLFTLALLVVLGGVVALTLLKLVRRELRFASRDPRELAAACRRDVVGFLADQRYEVPASATLAELGDVLERTFVVDAGPFVRSVASARFGRPDDSAGSLRRARRELKTLRRQMRRQLGIPSRLRGALSLRSLTV